MQTGGSNPGKLDYCEEVLEATGEMTDIQKCSKQSNTNLLKMHAK